MPPILQLAGLVRHHARYRPDHTSVVFESEHLTWREFAGRVARCANVLRSLSVRKGDKVATVLGNCRELLEVYWAVPSIGAVLVPLSPLLTTSGLESLLRDSEAKVLISQRSLAAAASGVPGVRVLYIEDEYAARTDAAAESFEPGEVGADDLFNIMYTSGTTGLPKGIMHTHFVRSMYALLFASSWRMTPESRVLHTGAIVFNGAFVTLMPVFYLGGTYVLLRQFEPEAMLEVIERERITHVMVVPSQIIALLAAPKFDPARLQSLEMILSLGAPLLNEYKEKLNRLLPRRFYELYGLTEGFVTILDREDAVRKAGSVGVPTMFQSMRIVAEDGSDCAPGEIGEICGRGPLLMTGYYKRPDLTEQAMRGGWLHSGDLGYVDEEGFLYLVDRKKDMIDSGGVKVYPKDLEEIAAQHPAVREVAVFGVPHEKWGETPLAAVVLQHHASTGADELRDWINARVAARYQRLSAVVIMKDFPRSAAGKVLKRELREPYWKGRERVI
ncbi:MAG TPA: AMP-binding protein [Burkholderiales bacterium]|nr:AMP-binding protein [Burkholderiales bacterium]